MLELAGMVVGGFVAAFMLCWALFILVVRIGDKAERTDCKPCELGWRAIMLPLAIVAGLLDVFLQYTLFCIMGRPREATISMRLKKLRQSGATGWRRRIANFVCDRMLNPHDPGHC